MILPKKTEIEESITETLSIENGIFNHPVVILSREIYRGKVAIFVVRSFDNTPIERRHHDPVRRQSYLPIHPATHPDTRRILIAAHGKTMKKQSYVNTKNIYEIPFIALRPCWRDGDLHLEKESVRLLASELWKQNVAELSIRLEGHGIFERVAQSAYNELPVPAFAPHAERGLPRQLGHDTSFTGTSRPLPASYGTFAQSLRVATHPQAPTTTTASRDVSQANNYPRGIYQGRQSVPARPGDPMSLPNGFPTARWTFNEANTDADGPNWLALGLTITCVLVAAWYWFRGINGY
ncbi:glycosyl hydrolase [Fusarium flagelliforme]|uniref:Glycosyl hydrolase n=2 Tax=Fusarium flagelliforme TaxID=2675880 RepID=A0A395M4M9_9HYPO|nr:glycosyl hydrolase [Fusarium flagelliforme]